MHPPPEWTKKWAYDHPWLAFLALVFGAAMIGLAIGIVLSD